MMTRTLTPILAALLLAVAPMVHADATKAKFRPLEAGEGLTALRQREIDILARPTDWTLELQAVGGFDFVAVSYFDGQTILVRKAMGIDSALQLSGARICLADQPRLRSGLTAFFGSRKMPIEVKVFARQLEAAAAYDQHQCDALTDDLSRLADLQGGLKTPAEHIRLPPVLAIHPLGPVVRQGDEAWRALAQWTLYAMLGAEEAGLGQNQAQGPAGKWSPATVQLLQAEADLGARLGLPPGWADAIVAQVGNYGEVFERDLGPRSPARLERGMNNLWSAGGLMVAPRVR